VWPIAGQVSEPHVPSTQPSSGETNVTDNGWKPAGIGRPAAGLDGAVVGGADGLAWGVEVTAGDELGSAVGVDAGVVVAGGGEAEGAGDTVGAGESDADGAAVPVALGDGDVTSGTGSGCPPPSVAATTTTIRSTPTRPPAQTTPLAPRSIRGQANPEVRPPPRSIAREAIAAGSMGWSAVRA
jgi:hypothetical protein